MRKNLWWGKSSAKSVKMIFIYSEDGGQHFPKQLLTITIFSSKMKENVYNFQEIEAEIIFEIIIEVIDTQANYLSFSRPCITHLINYYKCSFDNTGMNKELRTFSWNSIEYRCWSAEGVAFDIRISALLEQQGEQHSHPCPQRVARHQQRIPLSRMGSLFKEINQIILRRSYENFYLTEWKLDINSACLILWRKIKQIIIFIYRYFLKAVILILIY